MNTQDHGVIDIISQEHDGTVVLMMVEHREWTDLRAIASDLERKFSGYLTFILKGGIDAQKEFKPRTAVRIDLVCQHQPPAVAHGLFQQMLDFATQKKIDFVVHHDRGDGTEATRVF